MRGTCISERCRVGSSPERDILGWAETDDGQVACHCNVVCMPTQDWAWLWGDKSVGCSLGQALGTLELSRRFMQRCSGVIPAAMAAATNGPGVASEADTAAKLMLPPM